MIHPSLNCVVPRSVSSNSTCVTGSVYQSQLLSDFSYYVCTASNVQPSRLIDDESGLTTPTYWQSRNMISVLGGDPEPMFVTFNLTAEFILHEVRTVHKILVSKISHCGGEGGPPTMSNLRKTGFNLVFCYLTPCNVKQILPISHL